MRVLSIIFGVMMVIFGIVCMIFEPVRTALSLNYFFVILVAVYGVVGIIESASAKSFGVGFVFSILSVLYAVALLCFPMLMVLTDAVLIYMVAGWLVVQGIVSIYAAIQVKKMSGSKVWIFQLIFGILGILVGIYSFFHPILFALTITWLVGVLIGAFFIQSGFSMIFLNPEKK